MTPEDGTCSFLTFSSAYGEFLRACAGGGQVPSGEDLGNVSVKLIIIRGPEAVVLTMDPYSPLLDSPTGVVRCSASEAYDRVHSANHVVRSPIISNKVSALVTYALATMGNDNKRRGLSRRDKA